MKESLKELGRRGQGAMEYLMTYGWVILVVLVIGVAMWRLGIFSFGGETMTFTGFAGGVKPQLAGTKLDTIGNFVGTFTNAMGSPIMVQNVSINEIYFVAQGGTLMVDNQEVPAGGIRVAKGDNFKVSGIQLTDVSGVKPGESYVLNVTLVYQIKALGASTSHTTNGLIYGAYEAP